MNNHTTLTLATLLRTHPSEQAQGIWQQEEARAERLSNVIRFIYTFIWFLTTSLSASEQPFSANLSNLGLGSLWCIFSLVYHVYLMQKPYRPFMKYLSTTVDVLIITAMLYVYSIDMGYSTTLKSITFMVYFYVLILTTLRFRLALSIYAGILTLCSYTALYALMVGYHKVEFGTMLEEFITPKINATQQLYRIMFLFTMTSLMAILVVHIHRLVNLRVEETRKTLTEKVHHERTQKLFERYFSTKIARYLAENPPDLGGKAQKVTVLICDLRGFTSLSEQLGPSESVKLLNFLFDGLVSIVFRHHGTLDKFLGDGMLIVFGVPESRADDAQRAVKAALEMVNTVREVGAYRNLEMGVAINTGEVIFGNIGSLQRMEFTVIGDTVNTASRMESLNRDHTTRIIISESTRRELDDTVIVRDLPEVTLRGKSGPMKLYQVVESATTV